MPRYRHPYTKGGRYCFTAANPQDGPITVAPPIGDTSPPPMSPGGDDRRVRPPTGWVPGGQPENREAQLFVIYVSREQWKKNQESGLANDLEEALRLDQAMRDGKLGDKQARERAQQLAEDVRRKLNNLDRQVVEYFLLEFDGLRSRNCRLHPGEPRRGDGTHRRARANAR